MPHPNLTIVCPRHRLPLLRRRTETSSCTFPDICVTPLGRWACVFRGAPKKIPLAGERVWLCFSEDQGKTWSAPVAPFEPPEVDGRRGTFRLGGLTPLPDGRLLAVLNWVDTTDPHRPFFNEATQGLADSTLYLSRSDDDGRSWSPPERIDTTPYRVPIAATGPALALADGRLAIQFELYKPYDDPAPLKHLPIVMFSDDDGRSFREHAPTAADTDNAVFYWDQRLSEVAPGRLFAFYWTWHNKESRYLNIHIVESRDGGRTWTEPWDSGLPGQAARAWLLSGDRLIFARMDREGVPTLKLNVSPDFGRTWPGEEELIVASAEDSKTQNVSKGDMNDAWSEMSAYSIGLPATWRLSGTEILLVWYAGTHTDRTDIHWARIAMEI